MTASPTCLDASPPTIVLIEDDEDIRDIVAEVLRTDGYNVFVAADGAEGLELVRRLGLSTNLILLDYMMPVLDGSEVLAILKGDPSLHVIPVVVVSAAARTALPTGFTGIEAWLSKPVEMQRLLGAVRQVLGKVDRPLRPDANAAVSIRFLARRVVDLHELQLASERSMFPDIERVGRNLSAAGAQEPAFCGLVELGRALVKASKATDLVAVREAAEHVRNYLASAAQANRPDVDAGPSVAPPKHELRPAVDQPPKEAR